MQADRLTASLPFEAALLDCCFGEHDAVSFAGGLNRQVARIDWNTLKSSILGTHADAVKSLVYSTTANLLVSGSWDSTITGWDAKASTARVATTTVPGKVYSMDTVGNLLIVAMSERHVQLFDLRKMEQPLQTRESSLRHQTRCVRLSPAADSFAISSIEGRVGIEMVDPEAQDCNFAFKCHRAPAPDQENTELVYPVNALAFHPRYAPTPVGLPDRTLNC